MSSTRFNQQTSNKTMNKHDSAKYAKNLDRRVFLLKCFDLKTFFFIKRPVNGMQNRSTDFPTGSSNDHTRQGLCEE